MIGKTLSDFKITAKLGEGGMGEVYRAEDTKLGREVAIKVLPEAFTRDPERFARFEREAKVLASLIHPNIATIHALDEDQGTHFLVMELARGEDLASRLDRGPIAVEDALRCALQITEALESAHSKGIVHRDLKPANLIVGSDGGIKVLDFGLAKISAQEESSAGSLSMSPTLTAQMTQAGTILGTAAYMSPEQARGREADKRSDIWAFGVVLLEMLIGQRAFDGETASDTLAAVLKSSPPLEELPPETPEPVKRLLRRCLEKDPHDRLQDIGDARLELEDAVTGRVAESPASESPTELPLRHRVLPWSLAALLLIATALMGWLAGSGRSTTAPIPLHASLAIDPPLAVVPERPALAISPDGRRLVYVGRGPRGIQLYLREMDTRRVAAIPGTEGASGPFFSPDGESVGFVVDAKTQMKTIDLSGGAPVVAGGVPPVTQGAAWGPGQTIVYTSSLNSGLRLISAGTGTFEELTVPDTEGGERSHRWPRFLPGGKRILFTLDRGASFDDAAIAVFSLETRTYEVILEGGSCASFLASGHLVFARNGALYAAPFDPRRVSVTGKPVLLLGGVATDPSTGAAHFAVSASGILAYLPGGPRSPDRRLVWVDRQGNARPATSHQRSFFHPRLSPKGLRIAVAANEGSNSDIWTLDIDRDALTRLTFHPGEDFAPVWSPDGRMVTHASESAGGRPRLSQTPADGSGSTVLLSPNAPEIATEDGISATIPVSWLPDGETLILGHGFGIWSLQVGEDARASRYLESPFQQGGARLSADGHWLAYHSDESGRDEVYVRPFPKPDEKYLISTEGGAWPAWGKDGREMFYRVGDSMMVVDISYEPAFSASAPRVLFRGDYEYSWGAASNYDFDPDGQRFLMVQTVDPNADPGPLGIVVNGFDKLHRVASSASN